MRFMPSHDVEWLPDSDLIALVSYVQTLPPVSRPSGPMEIKTLGKVLDRLNQIPLDIARRIDHSNAGRGPAPSPTAAYGALLGRSCTGCHGERLSGGRIPGAPFELPVPTNLTPHETGLKGWSHEDFKRALVQGIKKKWRQHRLVHAHRGLQQAGRDRNQSALGVPFESPPTELGNR